MEGKREVGRRKRKREKRRESFIYVFIPQMFATVRNSIRDLGTQFRVTKWKVGDKDFGKERNIQMLTKCENFHIIVSVHYKYQTTKCMK